MEQVTTLYRDPFTIGSPTVAHFGEGLSLAEMVGRMPHLPRGFDASGEIRIEGDLIPREAWARVRPKPSTPTKRIVVTFHAPIRGGGGGGGGKSGVALVASLVITIAAAAVSGGALAGPLGAAFAATKLGAAFAGVAITVIGGLLLSALSPPPTGVNSADRDTGFDRDNKGAASANGNILDPNGPVPRVIGTRKVFPPLAAEPHVYYDGEEEIVEAIYALAGPHELLDLRIDGTSLEDADDIEFETREGWQSDTPISLVTRQSRTAPIQQEMSTHNVKPDRQAVLVAELVENLPKWHGTASRFEPDQIQLQLLFAGGLSKDGVTTTKMRIPFRLRMRRGGTGPWRNLPELHYENATVREARATINIVFTDGGTVNIPGAPTTSAFVEARKEVPDQTEPPVTTGWTADSYFSAGAGNDYLTRGTEGSTNLRNVILTEKAATFYLDKAEFQPGIYEIEIKRGIAFKASEYTASTYFYDDGPDNDVHDFFGYRSKGGGPTVAETRLNVIDAVNLFRAVSVWNEPPVPTKGYALIAIKAKNRRVDRVSTLASGFVQDWTGTAWSNWTTTSNPAPHYRDILFGQLNLDPVPEAIIDDASLIDWRAACVTLDYTCDHIAEGERIFDLLTILAGCGFARPYQSEVWGVIRDLDRSAESPIQIFSPRNSRGFKWSKAFSRIPDGLRVNYHSDKLDFAQSQIVVYRNDVPGPKLEQVTYEGLTGQEKIERRAKFDLNQARLRSTFYSLEAPAEAIVCRRGSLVGVNQDVLETRAGFGRISSVQTSLGDVVGITLDTTVPVWNVPDMHAVTDMHAETDMHEIGRQTGVAIRRTEGTISVHPLSNATGETSVLTFSTPVPDDMTAGGPFDPSTISEIDVGCLAVVGDVGREFRRLVVSQIDPGPDLTARLTLLDEAQELWA